MQNGEGGDASVGDATALASLASILQGITAAVPSGPPPSAPGVGSSPGHGQGGPEGSPSRNSNGGANQANAAGAGAASGVILLPPGMQFPGLPGLNGAGLQNLAPYLSLLPGLTPGLGTDGSMPFALAPLDMNGQLNLAALLAGSGLEGLDPAAMDLAGLADPGRKGPMAGSKRGNDGSGPSYKRERSDEGRGREMSGGRGKCHVEGCNADLTGLSSYYQRYRTCEVHLKAPSIMKDGVQQRFCQQCGRFHELSEFDGNKRSCRSRLQSHNVRRRKRTEEAMASQAAAEASHVHMSGGPSQGLAGLGQLPLQQQHLLGAPQLDLLAPGVLDAMMAGLAGDASKQLKPDDPIAALINSLPNSLLAGLPQDPNQTIQLALQMATGGAEAQPLAPPLLDSLLKAGAAGATGLEGLPTADLQQQLALALAAAPAAAAALTGEGMGGTSLAEAAGLAAPQLTDPRLAHHAAAHDGLVKQEGAGEPPQM